MYVVGGIVQCQSARVRWNSAFLYDGGVLALCGIAQQYSDFIGNDS